MHNGSWRTLVGRMAAVAVAVLSVLIARAAWAENEDQTQSPAQPTTSPSTYQPYQPSSGPTPSANIIGYKPIPNSALEAAMVGASPAPPEATPAYPADAPVGVHPANGALAPGAGQGGSRGSAGTAPTQLPASYLTGIVGEGFYTLGRDDIIRIAVRNQPEFSGDFIVGFDGRIQYNYLGDIPIAGLTKYEVQQVLEKLLQKYIRMPAVNVMILAYNSKVVYVIGEVGRPGKFIMRGDAIKLREAILAAGLPTATAALTRVHVIKPDLEKPQVRIINVKRILYKGQLKDDVDLTSGEIVVVPSTVLSTVNAFLSGLLNPATRVARYAALTGI